MKKITKILFCIAFVIALFGCGVVDNTKQTSKNKYDFVEDQKLQSYLEIKKINIIEDKDTTHFDIDVDTEPYMSIYVSDKANLTNKFYELEDGKCTVSFDIQNDLWADNINLYLSIWKDDTDTFSLKLNKKDINLLKTFTYVSSTSKTISENEDIEKQIEQPVQFCNTLNSYLRINDLTIQDNGDSYSFHLDMNGNGSFTVFAYDPEGKAFSKEFGTIKENDGLIDFDVPKSVFEIIDTFNIQFIKDENDTLTIVVPKENLEIVYNVTFDSFANIENNFASFVNVDTSNCEGEFNLISLTIDEKDDEYFYHIETTSKENMTVEVSNTPGGELYKELLGKTKGEDTFEFTLSKDIYKQIDELCICFHDGDGSEVFISFWPSELFY